MANTQVFLPREGYHAGYLWYVFNQSDFWLKGGAAQPYVLVPDSLARKWTFPPLAEQQAIASMLDRRLASLDALVSSKESLCDSVLAARQGVILRSVTAGIETKRPTRPSGVEWLGAIPAGWRVERLASVTTKITNGYVGPTRDILVDEGTRYLQSLHIKDNRIVFTDENEYFVRDSWSKAHGKSILRTGDVLLVQTGDIGQVAVVPPEFDGVNCHALIIASPDVRLLKGEFLSWVLNSAYGTNSLKAIQTGALHPHLNCTLVRDVRIPVPPLDEQKAIVEFVERKCAALSELLRATRRSLLLLREYRETLISAAVTGKIDVSAMEAA